MKLWLLQRLRDSDGRAFRGGTYDCANGFVVRAKDEASARQIIVVNKSDYRLDSYGDEGPETWTNPELSSCEELKARGEVAVIIRDFNPG